MKVYLINILILVLGFYLCNRPDTASSLFPSFLSDAFIKEKTVIVVGGGLAGLTAAIEAHNQGHTKVILIEKEKNIGGNSIKATSGINAIAPSNKDSRESFIQDILASGGDGGDSGQEISLVTKLVDESQDALRWLVNQSLFQDDSLPLDLSSVITTRYSGHTVGRTHHCPSKTPIGWILFDTLKKRFLSFERGTLMTQTRVLNLLVTTTTDQNNKAIKGVMVTKMNPETGKRTMEIIQADAVILTTGGFAGQTGLTLTDNGQPTLLSEYAPQYIDYATTNGPWASGDGIRLATSIGALTTDMNQVQVHPTGFVDPNNPTSPTKFLAPESLRVIHGAVLLNSQGKRLVNEQQQQQPKSSSVNHGWMSKIATAAAPHLKNMAYLVLLVEEDIDSLDFYITKGLMRKVENGIDGLAQLLDVAVETLTTELLDKMKTGKTFSFHVALVTPVVHATMGGLRINTDAAVLSSLSSSSLNQDDVMIIPGLFAAGEVTGGVHGKNRLAGNALLECVVFGRTAGRNAALYARR